MKKLTVIGCLMLTWLWVGAQTNMEIVGTTANGAGKEIELYCYEDMLTMTDSRMDAVRIDSTGAFRLGFYLTYPRLVYVQVENYSQSFYVEPGRRYEVYLPEFDWDQDERRNVFLDPVALPLEFIGVDSTEMNLKMLRMERVIDSVIDTNRVFFDRRFKPDRRYMDTLERVVNGMMPDDGNLFLSRYKEFTLAQMRLDMGFASRKRLFARYIDGNPVSYHDENYMRFFFALYAGTVSKGTKKIPRWRMEEWVRQCDLARYLDSVGLDPMLRNEQVRELAVLEALKESYYDGRYSREGVCCMVRQLGEQSKFKEHRRLAAALLASFQRMEEGGKAPEMVLPDVERQMVDLSSLAGKWVYMAFVRVGDPHCIKEIETMAHFRDTLQASHPEVEFVCVECSREFQRMYHFLRNNKKGKRYNWTWLHFDGNYRLLERFGVVSYPTFLLFNPEGRLQYNVTPAPASGIFLHGPWEKKEVKQDAGTPFFKN